MKKYHSNNSFKYLPVVNNNSDSVTRTEFLRLSPELMLALSDKRATVGWRIYDTSSKVYVKDSYVAMGSGRESNIIEIERLWTESPASAYLDEELEKLKDIFYSIYIKKAEEIVLKPHGTSLKEYQSGKMSNGPEISPRLLESLKASMDDFAKYGVPAPNFGTALLFGGHNKKRDDMEIYGIISPRTSNINLNYGLMGSGRDRGEPEFERFFKSLTPEKKDNIELGKGLYVSFNIMIAAEGNVGVGGSPDTAILEKGKDVKKLDDSKSRLMRNLVLRDVETGKKETEKTEIYLEKLARDEVDVQDVIKEFSLPETFLNYNLSA